MRAAGFVNHNEAVAAITIGERETTLSQCSPEPPAPVGMLEAIEDRCANFPHVCADAAGFFLLATARRLGAIFGLPLAAQLAQLVEASDGQA